MTQLHPARDAYADALINIIERLIHPQGSAEPLDTMEACMIIQYAVADAADNATPDERAKLHRSMRTAISSVLSANPLS